jgi:hypothetical protein
MTAKSAYFNEDSKVASISNTFYEEESQSFNVERNFGCVEFPINNKVLWNRDGIKYPSYIKSLDTFPAIILSCYDVKLLLNDLLSTKKNNIDWGAQITINETFVNNVNLKATKRNDFCFCVEKINTRNFSNKKMNNCFLSIPLTVNSVNNKVMVFDSTITR